MTESTIGQGELQPQGDAGPQDNGGGSGINPAWNPVLQAIPEQYHSQLIPHLRSWDQGVQQQFQKIHSGYAGWKQFQDAGYDPATVDYALQLMDAINNEPRKVYDALGAYHQNEWGQQQPLEEPPGDQLPNDQSNENRQLQEQVNLLTQIILQQHQNSQQANDDAALESELQQMTEKYGQFDERFVLGRVMAGLDLESAVKEYMSFVNEVRTQRPRAPQVLSSGGQIPNFGDQKPKPGVETRNVVANLLKAAQESQ